MIRVIYPIVVFILGFLIIMACEAKSNNVKFTEYMEGLWKTFGIYSLTVITIVVIGYWDVIQKALWGN